MKSLLLLTIALLQTVQSTPPIRTQQDIAGPQPSPDIYGEIQGKIIRETPHFSIYAEKGFSPVDLDWLQAEVETIYSYVGERMGVRVNERFAIAFRKPDTAACPIRGLARWDTPLAQAIVFADEQTDRAQILGVIAHEIGHLFHGRGLKAGSNFSDLNEGLATWAAGKYWESWHTVSIAEMTNGFKRSGEYVPLGNYFSEDAEKQSSSRDGNCLSERDLRYKSWAAFLDFLISNHGMEKLHQLLGPPQEFQSAPRRGDPAVIIPVPIGGGGFDIGQLLSRTQIALIPMPPPIPDFERVYGITLEELEKAWWEQVTKSR
jgi:hypothetical protein